jgi:hypothetical protein
MMPVHRRLVAILGACLAVAGAYAILNPSYSHLVYNAGSELVFSTFDMVRSADTLPHSSEALVSETLPLRQSDVVNSNVASAAQVAQVSASLDTPVPDFQSGASALGPAIATAVKFSGTQVAYGDVVVYDPSVDAYVLASELSAMDTYGIVIKQPTLLYTTGDGGTVPVVQTGSTLVNVTLESGPIQAGDTLTASSIPGKVRRASAGELVIGTASESFTGEGGIPLRMANGSEVLSGTITVNAGTGSGALDSPQVATTQCDSLWCRFLGGLDPYVLREFARYLLSGLIAGLSITFAFRSFVSDANYGVISMGRNPRAKASIQSLVLFNAVLAIVIGGAGLFVAVIVLFVTA